MEATEKIQGNEKVALLKQLKKDKTFVKMKLMGRDYEQLTMITDVGAKSGYHFFQIDTPRGFTQAVDALDLWEIDFEFIADDGVQYEFKTSGGKISGNDIRISFPKYIERLQRRKDFRLEFPQGTVIRFEETGSEYELNVINLSMGGALSEFSFSEMKTQDVHVLNSGEILQNIEIISPVEEKDIKVKINKALILRSNPNSRPGRYILGLQFTEMENEEIKALRELIYNAQRAFLQKRLKTNA